MTKRRVLGLVGALVALAVAAVVIPRSPLYLLDLLNLKGRHKGRPTRAWVKDLKSDDAKERVEAAQALGSIGDEADVAVPSLANMMLKDSDRAARIEAALALYKMAPASREALPELICAVSTDEPFVRMNAVQALGRLKTDAHDAVPALIEALGDSRNNTNLNSFNVTIYEAIVRALGKVSAGTADAVPTLTAILAAAQTRQRDMFAQTIAFAALGNLRAAGTLGAALTADDDTGGLRITTMLALMDIGEDAKPALPYIRPMLKDKVKWIRETAQDSVELIEGKSPTK